MPIDLYVHYAVCPCCRRHFKVYAHTSTGFVEKFKFAVKPTQRQLRKLKKAAIRMHKLEGE